MFEPGVAGPDPCFGNGGSEFCRKRWDNPNKSPKLFRPVDVEVRAEGNVGVGKGSSLGTFRKELSVEDLPRMPSLARVGEDLEDEAVEDCRNSCEPGAAIVDELFAITLCEGDGRGEASPPLTATSSAEGDRRDFTAADSVPGIRGLFFCGRWERSNNGDGFFRRGSRKNVVVVWMVCVVVVVVAYTPWSPELPSDLEDSDRRFTGSANVEVASSPYAGGEVPA